jgi:hypothetical protein
MEEIGIERVSCSFLSTASSTDLLTMTPPGPEKFPTLRRRDPDWAGSK